jgi:valyl-tRNA synthetase
MLGTPIEKSNQSKNRINRNMELSARYTPSEIEERWYAHWEGRGYFRSVPDDREPFSIVIPPPNVTGMLHMGHMLNNTIQDILIRKARLDGKNACWVPGTDHASIATEAKVVRWLREEKKLRKVDLTREQFMEYAYQWKDKYGGIILHQLRKLGASCDWDRTAFTMDKGYYADVIRVFIDLVQKGQVVPRTSDGQLGPGSQNCAVERGGNLRRRKRTTLSYSI